jgi:hypothetical protein
MSCNSAEEINEAYEDGLVRVIMNKVAESEGKLLFEEAEKLNKEHENLPSPESIKRFTILLDLHLKKARKVQKSHNVSRILSKSAVAIMDIIVILSAMAFSVQAFRVRVLNFLISAETKYTSLQLNDADSQDNGKLIVDWINEYVPTYMPDGYEVYSFSYTDAIRKIIFNNTADNSTVVYTEYISTDTIVVGTENASLVEKVKVNDQDGTISIKDSMTSIAWTMDNRLFVFQGDMSRDKAIKMAEGVKFIK